MLGETIKTGRIMLGWRKMYQKIGRRVRGSVDVSTKGFGPRRADIEPRISELRRSTGRLGNKSQKRTMRRRIGQSVNGPMTCRTT